MSSFKCDVKAAHLAFEKTELLSTPPLPVPAAVLISLNALKFSFKRRMTSHCILSQTSF